MVSGGQRRYSAIHIHVSVLAPTPLPSRLPPNTEQSSRTQIVDFPSGSAVKNLSAMQETQVQSLDQEDPLEKGMATYFSILAWRIPWTEEPGGLQSMELQESDTT